MSEQLSRVLIETVVRNTLKDIQDAPERGTRKLVDMALHFTSGQHQTHFFEIAHAMLEDENSSYYAIIRDAVTQIDEEHLVQFGLNVGYNSCIAGTKAIRAAQQKEHIYIPWTLFLQIDTNDARYVGNRYQSIVHQGRALGIYTWMLFCRTKPNKLLPLITANPECAFVVFCRPHDITDELIEQCCALPQMLLAVHLTDGAQEVCQRLRASRVPYAVFGAYSDGASILNDVWITQAEALHPVFSILIPMLDCPEIVQQQVYDYTLRIRSGQRHRTVLIEMSGDLRAINRIVSGDSCITGFDIEGHPLSTCPLPQDCAHACIFQSNLIEILRMVMPNTAHIREKAE